MDYRQRMDLKNQTRRPAIYETDGYYDQRMRKQAEDERMNRKQKKTRRRPISMSIFLWVFQIVLVVTVAYLLVYLFGQMRTNVGQSMDTTLTGGDTVFINTAAYQLKGPKRGDIVSFKPNGNESSHSSIKRIIGLPGETIQIVDGMILIDGMTYIEPYSFPAINNPGMAAEPISLGINEYFVLGDNRNNSEDSRYADVGVVTAEMIEGRVWFVANPKEHRGLVESGDYH